MESEQLSPTPGPVSPPAPPASPSPSPSPPAATVSQITALVLQLAALAVIARPVWRAVDACLTPDPPAFAIKILAGAAVVIAIVAAPTPSLTAALGFAKRFTPGGK